MKPKQLMLIGGDLAVLLLFVFIGQVQHGLVDAENPLFKVLGSAWIFALVWLVVGWLIGAFPAAEEDFTRRNLIYKSLNAWLVTVLLGVTIRAFWVGSTVVFRSFILASIGFGLLFIWAWRIPFWLWHRKSAAKLYTRFERV